tara:strand:- start:9614 stop:11251 length:1638 start_codon:yes stop_codon:yes gene_type:complete
MTIDISIQDQIFDAAERWKLIVHPINFEALSNKYKSFYYLRNKADFKEDEEAQNAFQPFSNLFSKINNSPLPYSHPFFEIEKLEEKLLLSSLQNTHQQLYSELIVYLEFFIKLKEHNTNPILELLNDKLLSCVLNDEDISKKGLLIKRSYLKNPLEIEVNNILEEKHHIQIFTHSELVNSNEIYEDIFSFGPIFDLTQLRGSRVLLSPKFLTMNVIANDTYGKFRLDNISLMNAENGYQLSKQFHIPRQELSESIVGPDIPEIDKNLLVENMTEEDELNNLKDLENAETEEYLISQGIKERGSKDIDEVYVSAVIFHLSNQLSYLVPDENKIKFIESEELDSSVDFLTENSKAKINKQKPELISSGDAILIFEGGEGTYTSELSYQRLGSKYTDIKSTMLKWKSRLRLRINERGLRAVSSDLISLGLSHANTQNVRNWSSEDSGGPGQRQDFSILIKYLKLEGNFVGYLESLIKWRREHQRSGRALSKMITNAIKSRDLKNIKQKGFTSFSIAEFEGAEVKAYLINSTETLHNIPLNRTKKLIGL